MTLTEALRQALDPATREEGLRAICDFTLDALPETPTGVSADRLDVACVAGLLLFGFGGAPNLTPRVPTMMEYVSSHLSQNVGDAVTVMCAGWDSPLLPRSAEWTAAAERLAAWADGVSA